MRKAALITGASAGFGVEFARVFARDRNDVVLTARREDRLTALAGELEAEFGITAHAITADLAEPGAGRRLFDEVQARGIEVEYLVNNAGFGTFGPFAETDPQESIDLVQVNIAALTELTALFLPLMVARDSGRVLNVASAAAFQPGPLMATYYASKAYVLHFSEAVNEELEDNNVSVTALCPGPVLTEFQQVAEMEKSGLVRNRSMMSVEEVVDAGYQAMMRGKSFVVPGLSMKLSSFAVRFAPRRMAAKMVRRIQEEKDE